MADLTGRIAQSVLGRHVSDRPQSTPDLHGRQARGPPRTGHHLNLRSHFGSSPFSIFLDPQPSTMAARGRGRSALGRGRQPRLEAGQAAESVAKRQRGEDGPSPLASMFAKQATVAAAPAMISLSMGINHALLLAYMIMGKSCGLQFHRDSKAGREGCHPCLGITRISFSNPGPLRAVNVPSPPLNLHESRGRTDSQ